MPLPITIYSQPACQNCKVAENYMTRNNVPTRMIDVTDDPEAMAKLETWGYKSTPVFFVPFDSEVMPGEHWQGIEPDRLSALARAHNSVSVTSVA